MNTIFEAKSHRVKGISFHPTNPWIITSLHNGEILLYDYVNGMLIHKFVEHEGPVRSVHFHNSQPFFVSGGDDCKIKVWNYNTKKCLFNLTGHTDYIRTVQFHHELPWIVSACDDYTIRIWNWLNRTLLTTATGHDHYVMSAFFHHKEDLIVSASLDQTVRIWDYSVLRKRFFEARTNSIEVIAMDVVCKFKMEGHERGVNWAIFHPSLPLVASASDDKTIRIWKFSESKFNEADTLRGHSNNVSCITFHPHFDYLVSNSEDKSIRFWDLKRKHNLEKSTNETDRNWILATHPTMRIFASGSDGGFVVFNIEDFRYASANAAKYIVFNKGAQLMTWKHNESEQKKLAEYNNNVSRPLRDGIADVVLNPFVNFEQQVSVILLDSLLKKGIHYRFANDGKICNTPAYLDGVVSACFIANNKLLALHSNETLAVYDAANPQSKMVFEIPGINSDKISAIFQGPLGKVIVKLKSNLVGLLDMNTKKVTTNEISDFKFVIWNANMTLAALVGSNHIYFVNKNLEVLHKVKENAKIKSAKFDENSVLFYTTHFHVKFCLQNGLNGIIKSLESPRYLMAVVNGVFYYSDSIRNLKTEAFNYMNVRFKLSLFNTNYDDVVNILRASPNIGLKTIENIQNAGFPDLSLKYVNDPKQKFSLALQSGKLEEAMAAADILKEKVYYEKLAEKAMSVGKLNIAEFCYVKSQNLDKLIFIYMLTGRFDKLKKLEELLKKEGENSRRFTNSLFTCNIEEKIRLLMETGHYSMALLTARVHQKHDLEKEIMALAEENGKKIELNDEEVEQIRNESSVLVPLKKVVPTSNKEYHSNWVIHTEIKQSHQSQIDNILNQNEESQEAQLGLKADESSFTNILSMTSSSQNIQVSNPLEQKKGPAKKVTSSKWNEDEEEENDEEIQKILETKKVEEEVNIKNITSPQADYLSTLYSHSSNIGIQAALGNIGKVFNFLKAQLGVTKNLEQFKPIIKDLYMSNYSQIKLVPCVAPNDYIIRQTLNDKMYPLNGLNMNSLNNRLNAAYESVTAGEMNEALKQFRNIIKYCIFFIAPDKQTEETVKSIINICTEYIYLMRLYLVSEENKNDKVKYAEYVCLMTLCDLKCTIHNFLIYKKAKIACKNIKNFITALALIKKLLPLEKDLGEDYQADFEKARSEFENFQKIGTNQHNLNFNINANYKNIRTNFCSRSFALIESANKYFSCPLCNSITSKEFAGQLCDTCNICTIGQETLGIKLFEGGDY